MPAALKVACVVIVCLGTSLYALPGGAQTSRTLVVAPDSDLVSGDHDHGQREWLQQPARSVSASANW